MWIAEAKRIYMARQNAEILAFNRGIISPLALARIDLERVRLMFEESTNWLPRVLGPMGLRPGLGLVERTAGDAYARYLPFIFATNDTALLEFTSGAMRVLVNDALVTRPAVSAQTVNGTFTSDVLNWTNYDEAGAVSAWRTGGYLSLQGTGTLAAVREQLVTVGAYSGVEHAIRVSILRGECYIRVGSTPGGDEYVSETFLYPGVHSLAFTPTGNFYVRVLSREGYPTLIDSITVDSAGVLSLPTPWVTSGNLDDMRFDQSGDVVFIACEGVAPMRVERRGVHSWSVAEFITDDGPFMAMNTSPITMTASALTGEINLTASSSYFRPSNVGSLMKLASVGQNVFVTVTAEDTWSDPIRVTGVAAERAVTVIRTGTWAATVTLQRSIGAPGDWTDVTTYTTNATISYNDTLDNQIIYYRIGVAVGDYTSGAATLRMSYASGSISGWLRVVGYSSPTVVTAVVTKTLGATVATRLWQEGRWSPRRGYPSVVALHEGRLWFAGKDQVDASISDAYTSFDEDFEGDAGPISRSIGTGPVDKISWMEAGSKLLLGGQGAEWAARSSSFEEPMTPSNFNLRPVSTRGSAATDAASVDREVFFVDRSGSRVVSLVEDVQGRYAPTDVSTISPEVTQPSVLRVAVQRQPDTRVHFVLSDGTVAVFILDSIEEVRCWVKFETVGAVEDVVVLPGALEDQVYYVVRRTINGSTLRTLEKFARFDECVGGPITKHADGFVVYDGAPTTTISGLGHLEGETVVCWADGADVGTYTVASGAITLPTAVSKAVAGLHYRARSRSTKLAYAAQGGSALTQIRRVDHLGIVMANAHAQGLKYGADFEHMDDLPLMEKGALVDPTSIWTAYDAHSLELNGVYDTDARLCLEANAPRPCTLLGLVMSITTHEKL